LVVQSQKGEKKGENFVRKKVTGKETVKWSLGRKAEWLALSVEG
jgi:hypothetical protein